MSISILLDTQELFQEAKMKDMCRGGFKESYQRRSGPYLTTLQTSCQSEDLEKSQHGIFFVFDTLIATSFVNPGYGKPELFAIFSAAVCMLPSRVRVIPRYLNSVTSSKGVPSYVKVRGSCRNVFAEESHDILFYQCFS